MAREPRDTASRISTPHYDLERPLAEMDRVELTEYYESKASEMQVYLDSLENEVSELKRRLSAAPSQDTELRLYEATRELIQAHRRNRKLHGALTETREKLEGLKEKVEKLSAPPNNYGIFLKDNEDGTIDIDVSGRKVRVNADPSVEIPQLSKGQEVIVNQAFNVVAAREFDFQGEVVKVKEVLEGDRLIVNLRADEERVVGIADTLKGEKLKFGDNVLLNFQTGLALQKLPKSEVEDLMLEEVPDITYENIGGLDEQIEQIRDAIELPYLYPDQFKEFGLTPPKGILLYGPPGCGKTMIAKAVANSLAEKVREQTGNRDVKSYFINVKGPELLNKYVGETERKIREVFQRAKEKAHEDKVPVIIFFDEMDSMFRSRGTGVSSDMESTLVPQFLSEIDGVEGLRDVIVIGASNRQDLLDPAVLRPGRLDVKIKVDRPSADGAKDIFAKYLTPDLPIGTVEDEEDRETLVQRLISETVDQIYLESDDNRFLEVTYARGEREVLYFKDFASGAMIENIVSRAKKLALKRMLADGDKGITHGDLHEAVRTEFKENEDLPNTVNPDDWARISGRKGERIVNLKLLVHSAEEEKKPTRVVGTGQYL